jgi:hypothetical protein
VTFGLAGGGGVPRGAGEPVARRRRSPARVPPGDAGRRGDARLALPGRHNAVNALAAAAATWAAGWSLDEIVTGLARVSGVKGRMSLRKARSGALIIDDTYNANPTAVAAAIDYALALPGETWLVLGDMRELGDATARAAREAGRYAREHGRQAAVRHREESAAAVRPSARARHFDDAAALAAALAAELPAGVNLLVKGSRSMRLETVIERLVERGGPLACCCMLAEYLMRFESGFNVFQYLTFRAILGALTALRSRCWSGRG